MEGKAVSNSGLEWEDLALYSGKPVEIQQQSCFPLCNSFGVHDLGTTSASSSSKSRDLAPYDTIYHDIFSRIGGSGIYEPSIGLKLGIPKEYGDSFFPTTSSTKSSLPASSSSSFPVKRSRNSCHNIQNPCCQVEGCNLDLSSAKDYHRRHRICENHSKSPKVIVAGMERRFCQQCSRFHELSEFDDKKRSCRRRLSDHNARRRRVPPESLQFTPPLLSSAFYDHKLHHNFFLNGLPISQTRPLDQPLSFNHGLNVASTDSPMDTEQLSAHSLLSWSGLNESESNAPVVHGNGTYVSMPRDLSGSDSSLYNAHMNCVNIHNPVDQPQLLEYHLFGAPYESASFYHGHRNL